MSHPVTLCCLLADLTKEWQSWQTAFYQVELAELDPAVAQEFVELQVDREGLAVGEFTTDVLLCTMHHGHDIARAPRIDCADQEVDEDEEIRRYPEASLWTVCGMFIDNGQCYSGYWVAHGPRHAYGMAYNHHQRTDGRHLAISCVHPGEQARAEQSPTFADASCKTEEAMISRLDELTVGGT
jgi:hypothetical protein